MGPPPHPRGGPAPGGKQKWNSPNIPQFCRNLPIQFSAKGFGIFWQKCSNTPNSEIFRNFAETCRFSFRQKVLEFSGKSVPILRIPKFSAILPKPAETSSSQIFQIFAEFYRRFSSFQYSANFLYAENAETVYGH